MPPTWIRLNIDWRKHPRTRRLTFFQQDVALHLWQLAKHVSRRGLLPTIYLDPADIAEDLGWLEEPGPWGPNPAAFVMAAIDAMVRVDLLLPVEGGLQVRDWIDYQIDPRESHKARSEDLGSTLPALPSPSQPLPAGAGAVPSRSVLSCPPDPDLDLVPTAVVDSKRPPAPPLNVADIQALWDDYQRARTNALGYGRWREQIGGVPTSGDELLIRQLLGLLSCEEIQGRMRSFVWVAKQPPGRGGFSWAHKFTPSNVFHYEHLQTAHDEWVNRQNNAPPSHKLLRPNGEE